jgi:hypothetical protein
MSLQTPAMEAKHLVEDQLTSAGIPIIDISVREYPDEMFVIVTKDDLPRAAEIGNRLDGILHEQGIDGFVTMRVGAHEPPATTPTSLTKGVHDQRVSELVRLLTARSRTSEIQPSLSYVPDAAANISKVTAPRHHLIFGRRGAGKTSLMVEAKRIVEEAGNSAVWMNIQTYRREDAARVFMWTVETRVSGLCGGVESGEQHVWE